MIRGRGAPVASDHGRAVTAIVRRKSAKPFTLEAEKGCASRPALLKDPALIEDESGERDHCSTPRYPIARSAGERALEHFLAAGSSASSRPILHPASIFLDMSGEEIRGRLFLTADADRRGALPPAGIHDPRLPGLSRLRQGRRDRGILLSRPGLPRAGRGRRRARPDRPRKLWPQGRRSRRRRDLLAGDGGRGRGGRKARGADRRRRPVRRPARGARAARDLASPPQARPRAGA